MKLNHDAIARHTSQVMYGLCIALTVLIIAMLVWVSGYLVSIGWKAISLEFFTQLPSGDPNAPGGMLHALAGTFALVIMASLLGIPIGMLAGVYLAEYDTDSKLATPVRFVCDVLTGVPSIVVGILGYELLVAPLSYWDGHLHLFSRDWQILPNGGYNGWAGALALAFIMVPIVARTTEEMLRLVPDSYRQASIALGASKARTILQVVIPSATGSVVTGVMLAIARVAGETAPLLFTALGSRFLPFFSAPSAGRPGYIHPSDLSYPFPSLTVQIYDYARGPYRAQNELAWAGVLVLIALIFVLNLAIRFATRGKRAD